MPNNAPTVLCRCPVCGQSNQCARTNPATATRPCWCYSVTLSPQALASPPTAGNRDACLCPPCAQAQRPANSNAP